MIPRPEHPNPQFERENWINLNGEWEFELDLSNSGYHRNFGAEDKHFKPQIEHVLVPCKHLSYGEQLLKVLEGFDPYVCLIFANTREECTNTARLLRENGYDILELHGNLSSRERKNAMRSLTNLDKLAS